MQYELNENICVFKIMCIQKARLLIYIKVYVAVAFESAWIGQLIQRQQLFNEPKEQNTKQI